MKCPFENHIEKLLSERKYTDAINSLLSDENHHFDKSRTYFLVGECYRNLGKIEFARFFLCTAYQLDSNNRYIAYALARIYELEGRYQKAKEILETIIDRYPDEVDAYYRYGLLTARQNLYLSSLGYYVHALKLLDSTSYTDKKSILKQMKEEHMLLRYFDMEESIIEKKVKIFNAIGVSFFEMGDYEEAERFFIEAIILRPYDMKFSDPFVYLEKINDIREIDELVNRDVLDFTSA